MNCAICQSNVTAGVGQAIFTAECSHSFHFVCIANNVNHGNLCCPICRSKWSAVPFLASTNVLNPPQPSPVFNPSQSFSFPQFPPSFFQYAPQVHSEPLNFSDDEPLPSTSPTPLSDPQAVTIKNYTEFSAIPAAESRPTFPILVSIRAPVLEGVDGHGHGRTPVDLVTVLDISGSMCGRKIDLLKRAVKFVIENLGPNDRLSIVSFSSTAKRECRLRRMTIEGRESAVNAIESLRATGGTDIAGGLQKGAQVLEQRRERNPVSSIILLSDGQDNRNYGTDILGLLPTSIRSGTSPVHTFGFGTDHDATTMHAISDSSGGTFSFIESVGMIQDAFALCIGGLLSVVAQELRLIVRSASPGVQIASIPSGRHVSEISDEHQQGTVDVGSMYAEEEKQFLVYLVVPTFSEIGNESEGEGVKKTSLLDVLCSYKNIGSDELIQVQGERVRVLRPETWSPTDEAVCLEVDRERNRILVAEGIAEAQRMAETGNLVGAQAILEQRISTLVASAAAQAGDDLSSSLEAEVRAIRERMGSRQMYVQSGRAYALSGMSSHSRQRASTRGDMSTEIFGSAYPIMQQQQQQQQQQFSCQSAPAGKARCAAFGGYQTPCMARMVMRSQIHGSNPAAAPAIDPAVDPAVDPAIDPAVVPAFDPAVVPTVDPAADPAA